ncbi:CBS domain-containing protein [Stieleria marina]|uniref:Inosine 5'-monophosphate dehydrogenase n=1 Tax=Stieleria marina TaxID=1930275 RepID=A0A517NWZ2_9BACT|nr:inosine 5'-monophosphate dehydrogenase [Planctomycetes bacterium K23_9]
MPYTQDRMTNRRGVAAVESAAVLALIILGALFALYALSTSTRQSFQSVSMQIDANQPANATGGGHPGSTDTAVANSGVSATDVAPPAHDKAEVAIAVCVFCLVVIGGLYLRLWQKRSGDLKRKEEEVDEIHLRSHALRQILAKRNSIFNRIDDNWESILSGHAIVETYMSSNVVTVDPEMPKADALFKMQEAGFRRFMVKRTDGSMAGVVSRQDILSKPGDRVCDVMTDNPRMATPETEIHTALSVLLENRISCLPVVKDKMLVGLLSVSDLLMVLQCLLRDLSTRQIDPTFVEAQAHHDRCELMPEIDPQERRLQQYLSPAKPIHS